MKFDTPGKRLAYFIEVSYEGNKALAARNMQVKPQSLTPYLGDKMPPGNKMLDKIEILLGCSRIWILTGQGSMFADNEAGRALQLQHASNPPAEMFVNEQQEPYNTLGVIPIDVSPLLQIPVYFVQAHANIGTLQSFDDLPVSVMQLSLGMNLDPKRTIGMYVTGASMEEARIYQGDLVIIEKDVQPKPGKEVVAIYNGSLLVKRFEQTNGHVELHSAHNGANPIHVKKEDHLQIVGVVRAVLNYR